MIAAFYVIGVMLAGFLACWTAFHIVEKIEQEIAASENHYRIMTKCTQGRVLGEIYLSLIKIDQDQADEFYKEYCEPFAKNDRDPPQQSRERVREKA